MYLASHKSGGNPIIILLLALIFLLQWTSVLGRSTQERLPKIKSLSPHIVVLATTSTFTVTVPAPFLFADTSKAATGIYGTLEHLPLAGLGHSRWAAIAGYQAYRHRNLFASAVNLLLGRDIFPAHPTSGSGHGYKEPGPFYWYQRTLDPAPARLTLPAALMPIPEPREFLYKLEYNHTPYDIQGASYDTVVFSMQGYYVIRLIPRSVVSPRQVPVAHYDAGEDEDDQGYWQELQGSDEEALEAHNADNSGANDQQDDVFSATWAAAGSSRPHQPRHRHSQSHVPPAAEADLAQVMRDSLVSARISYFSRLESAGPQAVGRSATPHPGNPDRQLPPIPFILRSQSLPPPAAPHNASEDLEDDTERSDSEDRDYLLHFRRSVPESPTPRRDRLPAPLQVEGTLRPLRGNALRHISTDEHLDLPTISLSNKRTSKALLSVTRRPAGPPDGGDDGSRDPTPNDPIDDNEPQFKDFAIGVFCWVVLGFFVWRMTRSSHLNSDAGFQYQFFTPRAFLTRRTIPSRLSVDDEYGAPLPTCDMGTFCPSLLKDDLIPIASEIVDQSTTDLREAIVSTSLKELDQPSSIDPVTLFDKPSKIVTIDPVSHTLKFTTIWHALAAQFDEPPELVQDWFQAARVPKGWSILYTSHPFWLAEVLERGLSVCLRIAARHLPSWCVLPGSTSTLARSSVSLVAARLAPLRDVTITLNVFELLGIVGFAATVSCYVLKHFAHSGICGTNHNFFGWDFDQIVKHVYQNPEYPGTYSWTEKAIYAFLQWEREMYGPSAEHVEEGSTNQAEHVTPRPAVDLSLELPERPTCDASPPPRPARAVARSGTPEMAVITPSPTTKHPFQGSQSTSPSGPTTGTRTTGRLPARDATKEQAINRPTEHAPRAHVEPSQHTAGGPKPTIPSVRSTRAADELSRRGVAPKTPSLKAKPAQVQQSSGESKPMPSSCRSSRAAEDTPAVEAVATAVETAVKMDPIPRQGRREERPGDALKDAPPASKASPGQTVEPPRAQLAPVQGRAKSRSRSRSRLSSRAREKLPAVPEELEVATDAESTETDPSRPQHRGSLAESSGDGSQDPDPSTMSPAARKLNEIFERSIADMRAHWARGD
ncbi:hypothetical protein BKA70DRAFT_1267530 [Coprinopsis sp. MPI-PUGE-AT-0042]|nr:hypothetical protein BKA70DRAFT_1267530 [Coprinopsis sp. MPI-PUGE-AT-0042]